MPAVEADRDAIDTVAMYRASGYVEVEPFNAEVYADHWSEKRLA